MPLYEYQCDACAHRFEVIQKFSDPRVEICPKCGGAVQKLFSSPAIQFKGSGFYITDYARKSGTPAGTAKGDGGGESSGSGNDAKSSGSKGSDGKSSGSDGKSSGNDGKSSGNDAKSSSSGGDTKSSGDAKPTPTPKAS